MHITHSYLGTTRAPYRCLFFLLLEDYVQAQTQFVRELDLELERFARNLGNSAPLIKPFLGDIDATRSDILSKSWSSNEQVEIEKTPGLLMIKEDFDIFDPRKHAWIYFHLGEKMREGVAGIYETGLLLKELAEVVRDSDRDLFLEAHNILRNLSQKDVTSIFQAKPGIFGFSIDLIKGAEILHQLFRRRSNEYQPVG